MPRTHEAWSVEGEDSTDGTNINKGGQEQHRIEREDVVMWRVVQCARGKQVL